MNLRLRTSSNHFGLKKKVVELVKSYPMMYKYVKLR